jgi:hypothetical protein
MSFRKFGGMRYTTKHNIVSSNYHNTNNLFITESVGQPNSHIYNLSDICGNIYLIGNIGITENLRAYKNIDCSGNLFVQYDTNMYGKLNVYDSVSLGNNSGSSIVLNPTGNANTTIFLPSVDSSNFENTKFNIRTTNKSYNSISFGIMNNNYGYLQSYNYDDLKSKYSTQSLSLNPNGGNVGIGKDKPFYTLDVSGVLYINTNNNTSNNGNGLLIGGDTLNQNDLVNIYDVSQTNAYLYFNKSGQLGYWNASTNTQLWYIKNNGDATFTGTLNVNGDCNITGTHYSNGDPIISSQWNSFGSNIY